MNSSQILRRARGVLGFGLLWTAVGATVGAAVGSIVWASGFEFFGAVGATWVGIYAEVGAFYGGSLGFGFALALATLGGRRPFVWLHPALIGALAIVPAGVVGYVNALGILGTVVLATVGTGCAAGCIYLSRRVPALDSGLAAKTAPNLIPDPDRAG